jgi:hypothetical protein
MNWRTNQNKDADYYVIDITIFLKECTRMAPLPFSPARFARA